MQTSKPLPTMFSRSQRSRTEVIVLDRSRGCCAGKRNEKIKKIRLFNAPESIAAVFLRFGTIGRIGAIKATMMDRYDAVGVQAEVATSGLIATVRLQTAYAFFIVVNLSVQIRSIEDLNVLVFRPVCKQLGR